MSDNKFGEYLRSLRESRKLGVRACARKAGFSGAYLSGIELGILRPGRPGLVKLARVLGVDPARMMLVGGIMPNPGAGLELLAALEMMVDVYSTFARKLDLNDGTPTNIARAAITNALKIPDVP